MLRRKISFAQKSKGSGKGDSQSSVAHKAKGPTEWQLVEPKRRSRVQSPSHHNNDVPWTKKQPGRFKLMITAADDGRIQNINDLVYGITQDRQNKTLLDFLGTVGNMTFEYKNRHLLHHNHRGGVLFSVETPQEAQRCINLGISINGRCHRVLSFEKARADDICSHCSAWGHLERSCRLTGPGRCAKCGGSHRTDLHNGLFKGKNKMKAKMCCPNCGGNHEATNGICVKKIEAVAQQIARDGIYAVKSPRKKRGAHGYSGPGRRK